MKNLFRICSLSLFMAAMSMCMTSCGGDSCYECTGTTDADGNVTLEDLGTVCEGDDDGAGGTVTSEQLDQAVALYEGLGGTCESK